MAAVLFKNIVGNWIPALAMHGDEDAAASEAAFEDGAGLFLQPKAVDKVGDIGGVFLVSGFEKRAEEDHWADSGENPRCHPHGPVGETGCWGSGEEGILSFADRVCR